MSNAAVRVESNKEESKMSKNQSVRPPAPEMVLPDYEVASSVSPGPTAKIEDILFPDFDARAADGTLDKAFIESIRTTGILQPVLVGLRPDGKYLLIAGRRRVRAALEVGLKEVPIHVKPIPREDEDGRPTKVVLEMLAYTENADRQGMNAWDNYIKFSGWVEHGISQAQIAKGIRRSDAYVSQHLAIGKLDPRVRNIVKHAAADTAILSKARTLAKLNEYPDTQYEIAKDCFNKDNPWTFSALDTAVEDVLLKIKDRQRKDAEKAAQKEKAKEDRKSAAATGEEVEEEEAVEEEDPYRHVEIVTPGKKIFRSLLSYFSARLNNAKLLPDETEEQRLKKAEKIGYEKGRLEVAEMTSGQKDIPKTVLKSAGVE